MNSENNFLSKLNEHIRKSVTLKLMIILLVGLLLLIPMAMVKNIIHERATLMKKATFEVSSKWANGQIICGPVLTIPVVDIDSSSSEVERHAIDLHILPEKLNISGDVKTEKLKRGIYKVVVYRSDLSMEGSFKNLKQQLEPFEEVKWDKATITIGISDLRGIKDQIKFKWNERNLAVEPGSNIPDIIEKGITFSLSNPDFPERRDYDFSLTLDLQGSHNLSFVPLGATTKVDLRSSWQEPKFDGAFLPDKREVSSNGFEAKWKVLELNRNYPQHWKSSQITAPILYESRFGVDLILPVNDYQKSMRSIKYAIMAILLTFLVFFLTEIMNKQRIHPFQYTLVGLALVLFYTLLVALSEHLSFNVAYIISSSIVILMISLYSLSVFNRRKYTFILAAVLTGIYISLFVNLQLSDYALLLGSAILTIMLALAMYLTRKIDWYKISMLEPEENG